MDLFELDYIEVDEVSLVDKAANGEVFVEIVKRIDSNDGGGVNMADFDFEKEKKNLEQKIAEAMETSKKQVEEAQKVFGDSLKDVNAKLESSNQKTSSWEESLKSINAKLEAKPPVQDNTEITKAFGGLVETVNKIAEKVIDIEKRLGEDKFKGMNFQPSQDRGTGDPNDPLEKIAKWNELFKDPNSVKKMIEAGVDITGVTKNFMKGLFSNA